MITTGIVVAVFATGCTASIRPTGVAEDGPDLAAETHGRALLEEVARAHGLDAWKKAETLTYVMTDRWQGLLGRFGNPWPDHEVKVRMAYRVGSFDARATFLSGDKSGTTWGLQSWRTYQQVEGGAPVFEDNDDAKFIIPAEFARFATGTIHYSNFRDFDGIKIPLTQVVSGSPEDDSVEDCIHVMNLDPESVQINGPSPATFAVDPDLNRYDDQKPASG